MRRIFFVSCLVACVFFTVSCKMTWEEFQNARQLKKLTEKAEGGDAAAQDELGICYLTGKNVERNPFTAGLWFRTAAEQNYPLAQYHLGLLCFHGEGMIVSYEQAMDCFQSAAKGGVADAMFHLALMYEKGLGVAEDAETAKKWYHTAADAGQIQAMYVYATILLKDENAKLKQEGMSYLKHAADLGFAEAQYAYAMKCYERDGKKELSETKKWLELAAGQNHPEALMSLAMLLLENENRSTEDIDTAMSFVKKAAEQHLATAEYFLGMAYQKGQYVTADEKTAKKWLELAAQHGISDAEKLEK